MSNEIQRVTGEPTISETFADVPAAVSPPSFVSTDGTYLGPSAAAAKLTEYLAGLASRSITNAENRANSLPKSMTAAAVAGNGILVAAMGDNPVVRDNSILGLTTPGNAALIEGDFEGILTKVKSLVSTDLKNSWLMQYFPASLPNGLDPLLQMVTSGTIVTEAMQEIIWERAKQQTARDASRARRELVSQWASKGFSMPGGVVSKKLDAIEQNLQFANADLAAQQAIKALDIQVDAVKFAADVGTRLQLGLINGLTGLVTAYLRVPTVAAEYSLGITNARRQAYSAVNEYYRVLIDNANLRVRADEANADLHQRYLATSASFMGSAMNTHITAVSNAVEAYARTASSTIAGLNNVTSIGIDAAA